MCVRRIFAACCDSSMSPQCGLHIKYYYNSVCLTHPLSPLAHPLSHPPTHLSFSCHSVTHPSVLDQVFEVDCCCLADGQSHHIPQSHHLHTATKRSREVVGSHQEKSREVKGSEDKSSEGREGPWGWGMLICMNC
jgi:hypothetical protein